MSKYNPIFLSFPIESIIKQRQNEYYKTLSTCDIEANSTLFIEFMLECIYEAISSEISSDKSSEINFQSTDEAILEFIETKFGLKMVRRTITKYRKILDIPSSKERKKLYKVENL